MWLGPRWAAPRGRRSACAGHRVGGRRVHIAPVLDAGPAATSTCVSDAARPSRSGAYPPRGAAGRRSGGTYGMPPIVTTSVSDEIRENSRLESILAILDSVPDTVMTPRAVLLVCFEDDPVELPALQQYERLFTTARAGRMNMVEYFSDMSTARSTCPAAVSSRLVPPAGQARRLRRQRLPAAGGQAQPQ